MLRHNLLLIYRNFRKFRSTSFINLIGLSTGLACALLIYLWVSDELKVDAFHEYNDRLYIVMNTLNNSDGIVTLSEGAGLLAEALPGEIPEVESAAGSSGITDRFTLSTGDRNVRALGQFADKDYFSIFTYPLIYGQRYQVLADKNSAVISERLAINLFGSVENAISKTVQWQIYTLKMEVNITGVFRNIPTSSSLQFDLVLSNEVYKELIGPGLSWGNHNFQTFVLLKHGADIDAVNDKIRDFVKRKQGDSNVTLFLKPYRDKYLYGLYENGAQAGGRITYVKLFSVIAVFIVLIACINFMNLMTAKASRRIKEVGIKKAIGASRKTLTLQYMAESMVMAFASLLFAVLFVDLLLPQFNVITGKQLALNLERTIVVPFLLITVTAGLIAGSYPSLYLSGFSPAAILKGKFTSGLNEQWTRKGLVVFQFSLSVIFIVCVIVVYRQIEFIQSKNIGYDRDNIVYFEAKGRVAENVNTFIEEVKALPGVVNASAMSGEVIGGQLWTAGSFNWEGRDTTQVIQFEYFDVDFGLPEVLGIQLKEGRFFSRDFSTDTSAIVLNETAIKVMGLKDPVGKTFTLWGNDLKIIGIAKDFHSQSLHKEIRPFFMKMTRDGYSKLLVRIENGREQETLENIEAVHKAFNAGFTLDYNFLDTAYQAMYIAEKRVAMLSKYFAGLAILISCLGLFGLASFTAERRQKEIGIRKVLGSSEMGIVYLLSADFTKIVLIGILLALPFSYLIASNWLQNFAFSIPLSWWYFAGAGISALIIAWITVGTQALKAARINPSKMFKRRVNSILDSGCLILVNALPATRI